MSDMKVCNACAGSGRQPALRGTGVYRDIETPPCPGCSGTGYVYDASPVLHTSPSGSSLSSSAKASTASSSGHGKRSGSSSSSLQGIFGIGGFIIGAMLGAHLFDDHWVAILIGGAICAGIAVALYKLIIGLALIAVAAMVFLNSEEESAAPSSAPETVQTTQIATDSAPTSLPTYTPPAYSSVAEATACVKRSYSHFTDLLRRVVELKDAVITNAEKIALQKRINDELTGIDVSQCPAGYQTAFAELIAAMAAYQDANERRAGISGEVSWLGGVNDEQYQAIRERMDRAFDGVSDSARATALTYFEE